MNVYEEEKYPFLREEDILPTRVVEEEVLSWNLSGCAINCKGNRGSGGNENPIRRLMVQDSPQRSWIQRRFV